MTTSRSLLLGIVLGLVLGIGALKWREHEMGGVEIHVDNTADGVAQLLRRDRLDLDGARQRSATAESARYIDEHMPGAKSMPNRYELLKYSLSQVDPANHGLYCEFGVAGGDSINYIAGLVSEPIHGFDSFEGLPEGWKPGFDKGTFAMPQLPKVKPNVKLYKGWFKDSLPPFKQQHPEQMKFMHMDADIYASTKDVFNVLGDRIVPGTVIQFDEMLNYPGWKDHEFKAFTELVEARGLKVQFLGYVAAGEQASLKVISVGGKP